MLDGTKVAHGVIHFEVSKKQPQPSSIFVSPVDNPANYVRHVSMGIEPPPPVVQYDTSTAPAESEQKESEQE